jgi:uncharacterized protein involved in cysteine biosynthesis
MATTEEQKVEIRLPQDLRLVYWGILGVGGLLLLVGFGSNSIAFLIAACFFGIVARIVQAEHHVRAASNLKSQAMTPN